MSEQCVLCSINDIDKKFKSYYNNEDCSGSHVYFCSEACVMEYNNTQICNKCHKYDKLIKMDDGMLCASEEKDRWGEISCYDKYLKENDLPERDIANNRNANIDAIVNAAVVFIDTASKIIDQKNIDDSFRVRLLYALADGINDVDIFDRR
jgi:hypothetical protein